MVIYLILFQNTEVGVNYSLRHGQLLYRIHPNDNGRSCKQKLNTGDVIMEGRLSLLKLIL